MQSQSQRKNCELLKTATSNVTMLYVHGCGFQYSICKLLRSLKGIKSDQLSIQSWQPSIGSVSSMRIGRHDWMSLYSYKIPPCVSEPIPCCPNRAMHPRSGCVARLLDTFASYFIFSIRHQAHLTWRYRHPISSFLC